MNCKRSLREFSLTLRDLARMRRELKAKGFRLELFHNALQSNAIHAPKAQFTCSKNAIQEKRSFSIHFPCFFQKIYKNPKKGGRSLLTNACFGYIIDTIIILYRRRREKIQKINALQRVGGGCEPTRVLEYAPPRAFERTAYVTPSRFERISTVTRKVLQRHEWARFAPNRVVPRRKFFVSSMRTFNA